MSVSLQVTINRSKLRRAFDSAIKQLENRSDKKAENVANIVHGEIERLSPIDKLVLKPSFKVIKEKPLHYRVHSPIKYANYVVGKRYARGPFKGQVIDYIEKAKNKGRLYANSRVI